MLAFSKSCRSEFLHLESKAKTFLEPLTIHSITDNHQYSILNSSREIKSILYTKKKKEKKRKNSEELEVPLKFFQKKSCQLEISALKFSLFEVVSFHSMENK